MEGSRRGRVAIVLVAALIAETLPAAPAVADDQPTPIQPPSLPACPPNGGADGQLQADGWHALGVHCSMSLVPYDLPTRNVRVGNLWVDQVWFDPQSPGSYPPNPGAGPCHRFYVHEVAMIPGQNWS